MNTHISLRRRAEEDAIAGDGAVQHCHDFDKGHISVPVQQVFTTVRIQVSTEGLPLAKKSKTSAAASSLPRHASAVDNRISFNMSAGMKFLPSIFEDTTNQTMHDEVSP
ncbi:hypothetical protein GGI04_004147 [Coemansia thaxteri]|nr:hypothetical protein GGI04_004147 [Coemansia thaxteri]